jgi:glucan phosphorylase
VIGGDITTRVLQEIVLGVGGVRLLHTLGYAAHCFCTDLKLDHTQLMDLGRVRAGDASEPFCMTVLALRYSRAANGVSALHGEVSREMWTEVSGSALVDQPAIRIRRGHCWLASQ